MKKKLPLIKQEKESKINFFSHQKFDPYSLILFFFLLIFLLMIILIARLFNLTIVKGSYYRRLADSNRVKEIIIESPRGKILDREKRVLAENFKPNYQSFGERIISPRIYYEGKSFAHVIGYRQIASDSDLKNNFCLNKAVLGDKVGKKGIEKYFDCHLRGKNGKKLVEVNAQGKNLQNIGIVSPEEGKNIQITIDARLQTKASQLIKEKKGAVIGLDPKTGEILILASSPSYDPHDFEVNNQKKIKEYLNNQNKPLFNRATEGVYPPGSTIKPIIAAAALEEGIINEKTEFEDRGKIKIGDLEFGNWYFLQYGKTDGMVNVVKAIQRSNDIFFYLLGEKMGINKIKIWYEQFGLGEKTNYGLEENQGLVPFPFWKEENLNEKWYLGDTINLSIGQGYLLVTPLQLTRALAVFANNGYLCQPFVVKNINQKNNQGNCRQLPLSQKTLQLIKDGMKKACEQGGTGWPLFNFGIGSESTKSAKFKKIPLACKTGTAESHSEKNIPHAWITVFAPLDEPKIILTVLVEEGGQGSDVAGPIAKEILKEFFKNY